MEFCPSCGMLLRYEAPHSGHKSRLSCPTCPYFYSIDHKIVKKQHLVRKEVEPIFSDKDKQKSLSKNDNVTCPRCDGAGAFFYQMQTRSADEASTTFFMCCNDACKAQWRED